MNAPDYVLGSVNEAISYGANALMLYTGAPQNSFRAPIDKLKIAEAQEKWLSNGYRMEDMIIHMPYIINLANTVKEDVYDMGKEVLLKEITRTHAIGAKYMVLHPGSSLNGDPDESMDQVARGINEVLKENPYGIICLETMAGKGSEVGRTFEELQRIISQVEMQDHIGVCFDTCHTHDAGYDLDDFDRVLDEFDAVIGLDKLYVMHINDSKNVRGAHKDRHANIGEGEIGFETLYKIVHNPRLDDIPMALETPYVGGRAPYKEEIDLLLKGK
jgi:deoxyribonuclease-4